MSGMESADWRHYRGHLIIARKSPFLRRCRYEVWNAGQLLGTFRDIVKAELHVDALIGQPDPARRWR